VNAAFVVLLAMSQPPAASPAPAEGGLGEAPRRYAVVAAESSVTIQVGKSGLFGFAGHEHEVVAPAFDGHVAADGVALERSSVALRFEAGALQVTGRGEPAADVPKVQEAMLGPKVLDVQRFPAVEFRSTSVKGRAVGGGAYELEVQGELELHGVKRPLALPLRVELAPGTLSASGTARLRQSQFGIKPVSVAGVVKVKDELEIEFRIVAREQPD
jgi:polyisoprenoid-binding protein YceI